MTLFLDSSHLVSWAGDPGWLEGRRIGDKAFPFLMNSSFSELCLLPFCHRPYNSFYRFLHPTQTEPVAVSLSLVLQYLSTIWAPVLHTPGHSVSVSSPKHKNTIDANPRTVLLAPLAL